MLSAEQAYILTKHSKLDYILSNIEHNAKNGKHTVVLDIKLFDSFALKELNRLGYVLTLNTKINAYAVSWKKDQ